MNQRETPPGICPHIIQKGLNEPIEFYRGKLIVNKDIIFRFKLTEKSSLFGSPLQV
jgi:hypothetical protein